MNENEIYSRNNRWKKTNPPSQKARIANSMFIEVGTGDISVYLLRLEEASVNKMVMISLPELKSKFGYFNNACRRIEVLEAVKYTDESS